MSIHWEMSVSILKKHQEILTDCGGDEFTSMCGNSGDSGRRISPPKAPETPRRVCVAGEKTTVRLKTSELKESESVKLQVKKALFGRCFCASKIH